MMLAKRFFLMIVALAAVCATAVAHAVRFDAAEPIWITTEKGEINSSVIFTSALAILLQADCDFYFSAKD